MRLTRGVVGFGGRDISATLGLIMEANISATLSLNLGNISAQARVDGSLVAVIMSMEFADGTDSAAAMLHLSRTCQTRAFAPRSGAMSPQRKVKACVSTCPQVYSRYEE